MSECKPPEDRATNYATFTRNGQFGRQGREELRIGVGTASNGNQYANLRCWAEGVADPSVMFPTKVGVSIRRHELLGAIDALTQIARDMGLLPPDAGSGTTRPKSPPELPASQWQHYGGKYRDGPKPKPDASVDHTALYAGQGRRRVDLSEACKSAAFDALVAQKLED